MLFSLCKNWSHAHIGIVPDDVDVFCVEYIKVVHLHVNSILFDAATWEYCRVIL